MMWREGGEKEKLSKFIAVLQKLNALCKVLIATVYDLYLAGVFLLSSLI